MAPFFIDPNIARAKTIDTSFYLDPACLEAAKEKIFAPNVQEAKKLFEQTYGPRNVPFIPHVIPS